MESLPKKGHRAAVLFLPNISSLLIALFLGFSLFLVEPGHLLADTPTKPAEAILLDLAALPSEERTRDTYDQITEVIARLEKTESRVPPLGLESAPILALLASVAAEKPELKSSLASLFDGYVRALVLTNKIDLAKKYFEQTLKHRPDPNRANDELRYSIAITANSEGGFYFGVGRVEELKKTDFLGAWQIAQLTMRGYYGRAFPAIIWTALVLALITAAILLFRWQLTIRVPKVPIPKVEIPGWKKKVRGYEGKPQEPDDYSRMLALFGLDDAASEADIKAAYRRVMKEYHPDSVGEDEEKQAKFRDLKKAYERILEIRAAWFGG